MYSKKQAKDIILEIFNTVLSASEIPASDYLVYHPATEVLHALESRYPEFCFIEEGLGQGTNPFLMLNTILRVLVGDQMVLTMMQDNWVEAGWESEIER